MSHTAPELIVGKSVSHPEMGDGVVVGIEPTGFIRVFFQTLGERQVPRDALRDGQSWLERVISSPRPATPEAVERLWLAIEAAELPLMESAAVLTSAKIDLLPHQVVLTHRIASASPRRFLIADEVGLGKTIETALVLRELASRGEMTRALMVVPAGLVENWRRELNEVFNLDFEVFGSEGDVSDRKSNAFVKHNRLIASVDTLKRTARVKRLREAPIWDLVVFDEGHHLSVHKTGNKSRKTENYKLAEALRDHCRDLLLLSATPHQGDHFRFWMLIRLLDPTLFEDERDMVDNRHRLNAVVIRRTKADACAADGSPLFARRAVNTEGFELNTEEKKFYAALQSYLMEGYALAEALGGKSRAIGFVMTIFQKIAASSFAAVRSTLRRRLLMLTLQESVERDEALDVDGRDAALVDARSLIREIHGLEDNPIGRAQADQILADLKVQLLKKRRETVEYAASAEAMDDSEVAAMEGDEAAASMVLVALPEERRRIRELLDGFPTGTETKTAVLLEALRQLWNLNPKEKVVVFTTYLGSIDSLKAAIDAAYPGKGVEVLKGGDHGAKTAAQKRFKRPDGPRVLLTTAAGREGINLQFARILFNHDLPWNPMDVEQRIGRIHRYGQQDTAQVYNLVAVDTIEGKVFLMLEEKLKEIAATLGKVDERGEIAEDLRGQILGQLGSRLSYEKLYQEALSDPTLERTRQELEVAMTNANLARQVVFELFQDLEGFNLGDYRRFDDEGRGMKRLIAFVQHASRVFGGELKPTGETLFELRMSGREAVVFTSDRDRAIEEEAVQLLGLEHPAVKEMLDRCSALAAEERTIIGHLPGATQSAGFATAWHVTVHGRSGQTQQRICRLALNADGERVVHLERQLTDLRLLRTTQSSELIEPSWLSHLLNGSATKMLHRELVHIGALTEGSSYSSKLLGVAAVL
ncbi:MAG: helicase [Nitrospira sp. CR1.3]|nr:helicase [Nitrospira sp. CR1.3]